MVVMEWAQGFVQADAEPESLCDPLNGQVAELLKF